MIHNILSVFTILIVSLSVPAQIKQTGSNPNEITVIRTAIGIATIIELNEPIQAAIIGDQSSFKVEALDKAVTIKPLYSHAKSNLFLITEKRRYSFRLQTMNADLADYIVRVKDQTESVNNTIKWINVPTSQKSESFAVKDVKVTKSKSGYFIIQGKIMSLGESTIIKADNFWVKQTKTSIEIQTLYLSNKELNRKSFIKFALAVFKSDLKNEGLIVEIKDPQSKNPVVINLSKGLVWN